MLKIIKSVLGTKRFPLKLKAMVEEEVVIFLGWLSCFPWSFDLRNFKENRKATLKEVIGQIMITSDVRLFPKLCPLYYIIVDYDYDLCATIGFIIYESQMNSRLIITRIGLNFMSFITALY